MKIIANSKTYDINENTTLDQFLTQIKIQTKWVVVEHNGEPTSRDQFSTTTLKEGDILEVVTPIAGG